MAAAAIQATSMQATVHAGIAPRRRPCWTGTPEIYFSKAIDNSRLVKVEDPRRAREMRQFGIALCCLFIFVMSYAFQHFKAIEYGYKIEALKSQRENLVEMNRALRLEEASLRDPERIDRMAREMGLQSPQAGQVVRMDTALPENSGAEVASLMPVSVVSTR
jgi:cell division protein FtsL